MLLERDAELHALSAAFDRAAAGHGRPIVLEGAAGAGKSALFRAAIDLGRTTGMRVLTARGSELERTFAFGVVRQLFEGAVTNAESVERRRLFAGAAGPAARAVKPEAVSDGSGPAEPFATLHAIHWLALNMAEDQPLLLAVDDVHWADESSLGALGFLARRLEDAPISLLVVARPHEPGAPVKLLDELRNVSDAVRLGLRPLTPAAVAAVVRLRRPSAGDPECRACNEASAGNPLYLLELLRTLSDDHTLANTDPVAAVREASVPAMADRVLQRIERVAPQAPALASAMAVLGDSAALVRAAALAGVADIEASRIAHRLRRIEVISAEDPFVFVHPLLRRSVYDAIPTVERDGLHARAGELLRDAGASTEAIATHVGSVTPGGSSVVAATLGGAGEEALARGAPDEACRWFRRALEEDAAHPPKAELLVGLGASEMTLRDPRASASLERALELATEPPLRARIASGLAATMFLTGRWDAAAAVIADARRELASGPPETVAELASVGLMLGAYAPGLAARLELDRQALERVAVGGSWESSCLAAVLAALAAHRGEGTERVATLARRALEGGRLLSEPGRGPWGGAHLLIALTEIDEYDWGLEVAEEFIMVAEREGSLHARITATDHRGWIRARSGALAAAESDLGIGLDFVAAGAPDMPTAAVSSLFYLQEVLIERPSLNGAADLLETIQLEDELARGWPGAALTYTRGRVRVARGDAAQGVADLRTSLGIQTALGMGPAVAPVRSALALALPASEREEALALVAEEVELAVATGLPRPQGVAMRASGMLHPRIVGIEALQESESLLERSGARLEHARSVIALGAALRRAGRRSDARAMLVDGVKMAERCGALRLAARASDELAAAGGKVEASRFDSGASVLTASELRIARIAAGGATNREIAQDLFVSLKTVETHLTHAYAKLGLTGQGARGRLGQALESSPKG